MKRGVGKKSLGGIAWLGSSAVVRGVTQLFSLAILSRLLSPAEFGIVSAAMVVINLSLVLSELGVNAAVVQAKILSRELEASALWLSVFTAMAIFVLVTLSSGFFSDILQANELRDVLPILAVGILIKAASQVSEGKINRDLGFGILAKVEGGGYILGYVIVGPLLAYLEFGYWALVGAYLFQVTLCSVVYISIAPPFLTWKLDIDSLRAVFRYGNGITLGRLFSYGAVNGDNFVVSAYLGTEALGFYGRAYQLLVMPAALLGQVVSRVVFPIFSSIQDDRAAISELFLRCIAVTSIVIFPLQIIFLHLSDIIVWALLGDKWLDVSDVFKVLVVSLFFRTAYKINEPVLKALGAVYQLALCQFVYMLLVVMLCMIAAQYGLLAVAAAVSFSVLFYYLALSYFVAARLEINKVQMLKAMTPGVALGGILAMVSWGSIFLLTEAGIVINYPIILLVVVAAALVTAIAFFCSPARICGKHIVSVRDGFRLTVRALVRRFT